MGGLQQALARLETPGTLEPFIEAYRAQTGRPTRFSEFVAAEICERLENGESLVSICKSDNMPAFSTVTSWQRQHPPFLASLAAARRQQATYLVEEGKQIIDEAKPESMAHVQLADKQAAYRVGMAKFYDRETYGDKIQQEVNVRGVVIHTENTALAALMGDD